ncbi:TPA: elongation factor P [Candidatus Saccharibacteria bacterium]|nr:MAG: translation elongation factor P (EF-P)/translation initiation factor 5A (eIF-5A) [Candidatus Saccharibacteria bacterium GW2011_GWA2_46_10]OGL36295.1 MAG: elongation factor P [Candidatus Saccharibacteria bacterium RIFCSPHIGHO2_12_FULL_47_17]HCM51670.1 elongation factor P [Candidatus Saccharibacteria bacterium]
MALSFTDLKKGTVFQLDEVPYKVLDYSHKMMGRGSATVSVKLQNLLDGKILDKTFKGSEQIEPADVVSRPVQYLYQDNRQFYFMDPANYEQYELSGLQNQAMFIKEGDNITGQFFKNRLINIELPKNVWLRVVSAEEAVRGDTSTAITKEAQTETGLKVKVPAFIKTGDIISVDTASGTYRERQKT